MLQIKESESMFLNVVFMRYAEGQRIITTSRCNLKLLAVIIFDMYYTNKYAVIYTSYKQIYSNMQ